MNDIQSAKIIELAKKVKVKESLNKRYPYISNNDDFVLETMRILNSVIEKDSLWDYEQKQILDKEKADLLKRLEERKSENKKEIEKIDKQIEILKTLFDEKHFLKSY